MKNKKETPESFNEVPKLEPPDAHYLLRLMESDSEFNPKEAQTISSFQNALCCSGYWLSTGASEMLLNAWKRLSKGVQVLTWSLIANEAISENNLHGLIDAAIEEQMERDQRVNEYEMWGPAGRPWE